MNYSIVFAGLLLVYKCCWIRSQEIAPQGEIKDYCKLETFHAKCQGDEVIVIGTAKYGRMQNGRCISKVMSQIEIGCAIDAQPYLDKKCSGKPECNIQTLQMEAFIPQDKLPCPEYVTSFLEVSYTCEKVIIPEKEDCYDDTHSLVTSQSGTLSSYIAQERGGGLSKCPWKIKAKPGQQILLTLLDFSGPPVYTIRTCPVYLVIKEKHKQKSRTICGHGHRIEEIYKSISDEINVRIVNIQSHSDIGQFILRYRTKGCPDLESPKNGWLKRTENAVHWGCNNMAESWNMTCTDNSWSGTVGNCTPPEALVVPIVRSIRNKNMVMQVRTPLNSKAKRNSSLSVMFLASIGLILSTLVIIVVGFLWLQKSKKSHQERMHVLGSLQDDVVYAEKENHGILRNGKTLIPLQSVPPMNKNNIQDYDTPLNLSYNKPLPDPKTHKLMVPKYNNLQSNTIPEDDGEAYFHTYEKPKWNNRTESMIENNDQYTFGDSAVPPYYYSLDPSLVMDLDPSLAIDFNVATRPPSYSFKETI